MALAVDHHHRPLGSIHVPHWVLRACHILAVAVALMVILLLTLDRRYDWLQHRPGGEAFDLDAQPIYMGLFVIGSVVAQRFRLLGGTVAVFTASALMVFAARQFRLFDALVVFFGFLIPGVLWLLVGLFEARDERFHREVEKPPRPILRRRDLLGGGLALAAAALAGRTIALRLWNQLFGPTHPSSTAPAVTGSPVRWVWSGAVTPTTASVTTRTNDDDEERVSLLFGPSLDLSGARELEGVSADEGVFRVDLDHLAPATTYHYAFSVGGVVDSARRGSFRTAPDGPSSFSVAVGSCSRTNSNGSVYDTIRGLDPDLVIIDGDLHYADIGSDDPHAFRQILDHTLSQPAIAALLQQSPLAYVWDDHDYGGIDRTHAARPAALDVYGLYVPHHPLVGEAVYQAFSYGRVRFILTDVRSARDPLSDEEASMLGTEQLAWLQEELLSAPREHALTVWVNPVPWVSAVDPVGDDWSAYSEERSVIADHIADNALASSLLMVSGDAHMVAIDDGSNTDYSTARAGGFPLLHAGPSWY